MTQFSQSDVYVAPFEYFIPTTPELISPCLINLNLGDPLVMVAAAVFAWEKGYNSGSKLTVFSRLSGADPETVADTLVEQLVNHLGLKDFYKFGHDRIRRYSVQKDWRDA